MLGAATLTMKTSRIAMKQPASRTLRYSHLRRSGAREAIVTTSARTSGGPNRRPDPAGDGKADLVGAVLLHEVVAGDGDFGLVEPRTAELELRSVQDRSRIGP